MQDDLAVCPRCNFIRVAEADDLPGAVDGEDHLPPGTVLEGDYRIVGVIGAGGSGVVYEARQLSLQNARVALKVLHPDLSDDETTVTLLKREVIVSRELTHHNIMKVYNFIQARERYFIVMEYVLGGSLQSRLENKGAMGIENAAPIFFQACDALEYAHNRGVIHLDIKPANILIGPNHMVKLCDFGIARMAVSNVTTATQRIITGSVGYMPPEQYRGRRFVSTRSDIYSLSATFYTALTGEAPIGVIDQEGLPECVLKAMHRTPEERFESVADFKRAFIEETGIQPQRLSLSTAYAPPEQPLEQGAERIRDVDTGAGGTDLQVPPEGAPPESEPAQESGVNKALTVTPTRETRLKGQDAAAILKTKARRVGGGKGLFWAFMILCVAVLGGYYYLEPDITGALKGLNTVAPGASKEPARTSPTGADTAPLRQEVSPTTENPSPPLKEAKQQDLLNMMTRPADEALTRRIEAAMSAFVDSLNFDQENQAVALLASKFKETYPEAQFRKEFFGTPRLWRARVTHVGSAEDGSIIVRIKMSALDSFRGKVRSGEGAIQFVKDGAAFKISRLQLGEVI
jgi:serine/threonine-protein kinase